MPFAEGDGGSEVLSTLSGLLWQVRPGQRDIPGTFLAGLSLVAQLMGISEQAQGAPHSALKARLHIL